MANNIKSKIIAIVLLTALASNVSAGLVMAGSGSDTNINDSKFKLIVCDGPDLGSGKNPDGYVPCDFVGLMKTVQHLIDVAIVFGVLVAIFGFSYAGYVYIAYGNNPSKRAEASGIFRKVFFGFIIMLSAWFIVYQILSWLTGDSGFASLLGK